MRLALSAEQAGFAAVLHDAAGDWARLRDAGVTGLAVPERWGGSGADSTDLVVAFEELGHHAVPGPLAETLAVVPTLLADIGGEKWLPELAAGQLRATLAAPPWLPYAAGPADLLLWAGTDTVRLCRAGDEHVSIDPTRQLFEVIAGDVLDSGPETAVAIARAMDLGVLVVAAQLLGAGRALLEEAVSYARTRTQFGRPIGRFQAVQHRLADVAVGLEFARPLLHAAAVTSLPRDVSAAKVACGDAAHRAARAALQVHGAIGYTREHGLHRWLTKVQVLTQAWGTPAQHRARVLADLTR
ncbi:acyl-CoA dehydrogenase family protein [Actinoplanes sp. NPDC051859]|uniref:acyl-CoA dehydrogenase family protein n=1 Tax=Actinoplanes sp. NPDC051859 TaxID=3363909 RepID=UPI0037B240E3